MNSGDRNKLLMTFISAAVLFFAITAVSRAQTGWLFDADKKLAEQAPQTAKPGAAAKPQPQVSQTETSRIGNWQTTCVDFVGGDPKRICSAKLEILQKNSNKVAFLWEIGFNSERKLLSVMHVPTGILTERGVELNFGRNAPSKIEFHACAPNECTANFPMDDKMVKDLLAAKSVDATIIAMNGDIVKFSINPDGLDKVIKKIGN